jgi:penicillin-binding protein 2
LLKDVRRVMENCASILGFPPEKLRRLIESSRSTPKFMPFPIKKNMTLKEVSLIKARIENIEGGLVAVKPYRAYPQSETLCHVIGTLGEVSKEDLAKGARMGYKPGDLLGKSGVEKEYEGFLRGQDGWERIEINAGGKQVGLVGKKPPRAGAEVTLTVDASLQRRIEEVFIHRAGSVVAMEPDTGRVLAMVSKPGFDLNLFSPSISEREWKALQADPLHPLENRAVRGAYSPASAFKMIVAAAALAEGLMVPEETVECKGLLELKNKTFRCWDRKGHGHVNLRRALVESCDVYFYELGLRLGADRIARYASYFGLGKPTGIGLPQELPGLVPSAAWKKRTYGSIIQDGETVTLAIGQGYLVGTPMQMAVMTACLANGGRIVAPTIVDRIQGADGRIVFKHSPAVLGRVPVSPKHLALLKEAMIGVVSERKGTGRKCAIPGFRIGGKTGTSQVISTRNRSIEEEKAPYHERAHAIFVAFVDDKPKKLALVVVVEHGGGGGASAAPIARKIIAHYYGVPDPGNPRE